MEVSAPGATFRAVADMTIRGARVNDIPALSALAKRTWSDAFGASLSAEDEAIELEKKRSESYFAASLGKNTILVAEANGELRGYVQFGDVDIAEVDVQPGDQELQRLYVDAGLHGTGVGRRLLEEALRHPRLATARRIYLQAWDQNERALRLYESVGFRIVGTTRFILGTEEVEDLVMMR
jgi:ribosomal protein S18 acetylase RimI-like enzyme